MGTSGLLSVLSSLPVLQAVSLKLIGILWLSGVSLSMDYAVPHDACSRLHCENHNVCRTSIKSDNTTKNESQCLCRGKWAGLRCEIEILLVATAIQSQSTILQIQTNPSVPFKDMHMRDVSIAVWNLNRTGECDLMKREIQTHSIEISGLEKSQEYIFCVGNGPANLCAFFKTSLANYTEDSNCIQLTTKAFDDQPFQIWIALIPCAAVLFVIAMAIFLYVNRHSLLVQLCLFFCCCRRCSSCRHRHKHTRKPFTNRRDVSTDVLMHPDLPTHLLKQDTTIYNDLSEYNSQRNSGHYDNWIDSSTETYVLNLTNSHHSVPGLDQDENSFYVDFSNTNLPPLYSAHSRSLLGSGFVFEDLNGGPVCPSFSYNQTYFQPGDNLLQLASQNSLDCKVNDRYSLLQPSDSIQVVSDNVSSEMYDAQSSENFPHQERNNSMQDSENFSYQPGLAMGVAMRNKYPATRYRPPKPPRSFRQKKRNPDASQHRPKARPLSDTFSVVKHKDSFLFQNDSQVLRPISIHSLKDEYYSDNRFIDSTFGISPLRVHHFATNGDANHCWRSRPSSQSALTSDTPLSFSGKLHIPAVPIGAKTDDEIHARLSNTLPRAKKPRPASCFIPYNDPSERWNYVSNTLPSPKPSSSHPEALSVCQVKKSVSHDSKSKLDDSRSSTSSESSKSKYNRKPVKNLISHFEGNYFWKRPKSPPKTDGEEAEFLDLQSPLVEDRNQMLKNVSKGLPFTSQKHRFPSVRHSYHGPPLILDPEFRGHPSDHIRPPFCTDDEAEEEENRKSGLNGDEHDLLSESNSLSAYSARDVISCYDEDTTNLVTPFCTEGSSTDEDVEELEIDEDTRSTSCLRASTDTLLGDNQESPTSSPWPNFLQQQQHQFSDENYHQQQFDDQNYPQQSISQQQMSLANASQQQLYQQEQQYHREQEQRTGSPFNISPRHLSTNQNRSPVKERLLNTEETTELLSL